MNTRACPVNDREVITVRGSIDPAQMGVTQTHEHLLIDAMDHYGGYEFVIDDEETVVEELKEFTSRGGKTICDVTRPAQTETSHSRTPS